MKQLLLAIGIVLTGTVQLKALPGNAANTPNRFFFQDNIISGKVTDDKGEPLAAVTIQVKGTQKTTLSNSDGSFSLSVPANASVLVFSFAGMEPQEINITGKTTLAVQLQSTASTLGDVIVVGYGTQKKTNLTGSVATVSGNTLTQRPATNAGNLLQGRLTGLQVTQPSAEPGRDNPNILIRGRATYGGSSSPLILIDGVTGSINNLSPNDIESVTVLKDAASASIYGARAANGVILITTKKGRKGQTTVNYSVNVASYRPTAMPDFITNSADYMDLYNAAAARSGVAFRYAQTEIDKYRNNPDRNQYPNFDAVDYYFNPATVVNHNLSLSGGSDKSTYNISLNYLNQDAMLPNYKFKKYNVLLNYTSQVSKNILAGTSMNLTYKDRLEPPFTSENMSLLVYAAGPLYGPFLPDGSGRVVSRAYDLEGRNRNPQEALVMGWQDTKEYNLNAQAYADIRLMKGLTWSSKVAVNYVDEYYKMYQHPYSAYLLQEKDPATGDNKASSFGPDLLGVTDQYAKTIVPTLYSTFTYETRIHDDHTIKALAGYEQIYNKYQSLRGRRFNGVSSALTEIAGYTSTGEALQNTYPRLPGITAPTEWAMQSFFGRINYDYKGKYFFEGNLRYDGTSKVSPDFRWGLFPSASAGWLVSREDFIRDRFSWISNLKLRASYGILGNQDIGTYLYQNNLTLSGISYPFGNTTPVSGAVLNSYKDQSIHWESTRATDIGLDFDMKNGLFGFTVDWFRKSTYDILGAPAVPASLGLSAATINNGTMRSQGIEVELRHQNRVGPVSYGLNVQVSTAKNKVLSIAVPSTGNTVRRVGDEWDAYYLYQWDGIFQPEDITNPKTPKHIINPTPQAGDLKMKDVTGNGFVDADDRVVTKGAYPDYIYSFGANVGYKGFTLTAFFQGVQGIKNRTTGWGVDPFMQGTAPTSKWYHAWTPQNHSNTLPAIYVAGYNGVAGYSSSTYYLMDASYLRLKNVVLSYDFPAGIFSRLKAKMLTVYVSADNLFTITSYEGSDPERSGTTGNYVQYPQAKIISAGVNFKF